MSFFDERPKPYDWAAEKALAPNERIPQLQAERDEAVGQMWEARHKVEQLRAVLVTNEFATLVRNAYYVAAGIRTRDQMTLSTEHVRAALEAALALTLTQSKGSP
jgi:hypothetical protein